MSEHEIKPLTYFDCGKEVTVPGIADISQLVQGQLYAISRGKAADREVVNGVQWFPNPIFYPLSGDDNYNTAVLVLIQVGDSVVATYDIESDGAHEFTSPVSGEKYRLAPPAWKEISGGAREEVDLTRLKRWPAGEYSITPVAATDLKPGDMAILTKRDGAITAAHRVYGLSEPSDDIAVIDVGLFAMEIGGMTGVTRHVVRVEWSTPACLAYSRPKGLAETERRYQATLYLDEHPLNLTRKDPHQWGGDMDDMAMRHATIPELTPEGWIDLTITPITTSCYYRWGGALASVYYDDERVRIVVGEDTDDAVTASLAQHLETNPAIMAVISTRIGMNFVFSVPNPGPPKTPREYLEQWSKLTLVSVQEMYTGTELEMGVVEQIADQMGVGSLLPCKPEPVYVSDEVGPTVAHMSAPGAMLRVGRHTVGYISSPWYALAKYHLEHPVTVRDVYNAYCDGTVAQLLSTWSILGIDADAMLEVVDAIIAADPGKIEALFGSDETPLVTHKL